LREPDVKMQKRKLDDLVDTHNDLKRKDMLNSTNLYKMKRTANAPVSKAEKVNEDDNIEVKDVQVKQIDSDLINLRQTIHDSNIKKM